MYTGKTKNLAVIGNPIIHSLSPVMQNAAIQKAGCDYSYIALNVKSEDLEKAVLGLRALNFSGFNVTIPHKSDILPLLDEVDEDARKLGAVNTVVNDNGKFVGYNTDVAGFIKGLKVIGFSPAGKKAVVLGAGGAAHAVIYGLRKKNISAVDIGVRNPKKAGAALAGLEKSSDICIYKWDSKEFTNKLVEADLIVNTTPLGMYPDVDKMPPVDFDKLNKKAVVYDVIYTPGKTKFLQEAEKRGHIILNGEYMLVGQGAAAFKLWTNIDADESIMQETLGNYLKLLEGRR